MGIKRQLVGGMLSASAALGLDHLAGDTTRGQGVIFMLHRVHPTPPTEYDFSPNAGLWISTEQLDSAIKTVKRLGFDIISMDEVPGRMANGTRKPRFAAFTLDDGYKDNQIHAYPVFKRHDCPFTIYIPSDWPSGDGIIWWRIFERIIAENTEVVGGAEGLQSIIPTSTAEEKAAAYSCLETWFKNLPLTQQRREVCKFAQRNKLDPGELCRDEIMSWSEIGELASDPRVTIGAHSASHKVLSQATPEDLKFELREGRRVIEENLGRPCHHLAYPFGDRGAANTREFLAAEDAGYETAVTTRNDPVEFDYSGPMTALPRLGLFPEFPSARQLECLVSGLPSRVRNAFRRV